MGDHFGPPFFLFLTIGRAEGDVMSVWTTKALDRARNYIVLQHQLKGVNYIINGIKFREGYAVVEKGSKTYHMLKRIPVLRAAKEYPITYLRKLSFISRSQDVKAVYGQDVYNQFLIEEAKLNNANNIIQKLQQAEQKEKIQEMREQEIAKKLENEAQIQEALVANDTQKVEELKKETPKILKCAFVKEDTKLCGNMSMDYSPSSYCYQHLLEDPKLPEYGITKPTFLTKAEVKTLKYAARDLLEKAKRKGQF